MTITLYLMTKKGFEVLNALINNNFQKIIAEVIIGQDQNIQNDFARELILLCQKQKLPHYKRSDKPVATGDFSIAVSWRWLIPTTTSKLIVLHDSLLPKYRGFAPLVSMLINKETTIGVSAIFANEEYDKGDLIAQSASAIVYPIKIAEAIEVIISHYIDLALIIFSTVEEKGTIIAKPQNEALATYSLWRNEEDYQIDWHQSSNTIQHFINAVSTPYRGASSFIDNTKKVRILEAELVTDVVIENRDVGKVIFIKNQKPVIVCGQGLLLLTKVIDDSTGNTALPLQNFRIRFT